MKTIEDHVEGYGTNYTGDMGFPKMKSHIWIYAFINPRPQKKYFDFVYVNELNAVTPVRFQEYSSYVWFCAKSFNKS